MPVLVDSSIWIGYFRTGNFAEKLDGLIDENLVVINDLILAELVPFLRVANQKRVIDLLNTIAKMALMINWNQIMEFQFRCLKRGLNGVCIPDLIIAQNALQNQCEVFSDDHHFLLMKDVLGLLIY